MVIWCQKERKEGKVLFNDTFNTFYLRLYCVRGKEGRKEGKVLFNDTLDTFYLRLYGVRGKEGRKERFYLMTLSTHFIYGYMVSEGKEGRKKGRKGFI